MNNKKYIIKTLDRYNEDYTGDRKWQSIHTSFKGSLVRLSKNEAVNYIAVVDFNVGKPPRGNHYHRLKDEFLYLCSGKVRGYFKDVDSDQVEIKVIEAGTLIRMIPGCIHAFEAIEDGIAIEYSMTEIDESINDIFTDKRVM